MNDLSALSKTGSESLSLVPGKNNDVAIAGGQILGDEYSEHVVKVSFIRSYVGLFKLISMHNRIDVGLFCARGMSACIMIVL